MMYETVGNAAYPPRESEAHEPQPSSAAEERVVSTMGQLIRLPAPGKKATPVERKRVAPAIWARAHEIAARYEGAKITVASRSHVVVQLPPGAVFEEE